MLHILLTDPGDTDLTKKRILLSELEYSSY